MKYSIIMPYYDRAPQLRCTLECFAGLYAARPDYEVILVEDQRNHRDAGKHAALAAAANDYAGKLRISCLVQDRRATMCPGTAYNLGVAQSSGEFIVISNPETYHYSDILGGLDAEFAANPNRFVVCACVGLDAAGSNVGTWYQHSRHHNHLLPHCAALSRANYDRVGGFDESFADGYARTDIDFVWSVMNAGITVVARDGLVACHQWHARSYDLPPGELERLRAVSVRRLKAKWAGKKINYDQAWVEKIQEVCW